MIKLRTPFSYKQSDEKEQQEYQEAQKEAEASISVASDMARKCLSTEDFKSYREGCKRAEEKLVIFLLKYNNNFYKSNSNTCEFYAMVVSRYLTKLESIRALLQAVTKEAQKGALE